MRSALSLPSDAGLWVGWEAALQACPLCESQDEVYGLGLKVLLVAVPSPTFLSLSSSFSSGEQCRD